MELLYRGSRDGASSKIFHSKCNNQGPTITLYQNENNNIFGGYASISWADSGGHQSADNSFIFTLTNIYRTEPIKFHNSNKKRSVYNNISYGPTFPDDIVIYDNFQKKSYSTFPESYNDTLGKGKSIFTGDLNNNNKDFQIKEIEVFKLIK